jgi:type III pantothenate kinase
VLVTVDIGNTQTAAAVFEGERIVDHWRITTSRSATADELAVQLRLLLELADLDRSAVDDVAISSVVPQLVRPWRGAVRRNFPQVEPLFVGPGVRTGISIRTDNPHEVGADRVVNAVAAWERYRRACVVVDMGTATTFDAVGRDGAYLGGAIAPGLGISVEALVQRAARLAQVELVVPTRAIGTNTVTSMQSGVLLGAIAQVDGMLERFRLELVDAGEAEVPSAVPTIATGGLAARIAPHARMLDDVEPLLTLQGLRIIAERHAAG